MTSDAACNASRNPDVYSVPLDDPQWAEFRAKFDQRDRRNWSFHIRANRDAIFAFGRPRNSFNVHFYYWLLIPALAILPTLHTVAFVRKCNSNRRGFAIEPYKSVKASERDA
jgi:hypothetical protein